MLSRRDALRGAAAVAAAPALMLPVLAAKAEDPALQAAADWQESWDHLFAFAGYVGEHPDVFYDPRRYGISAGPALDTAHEAATEQLMHAKPTTVAGATAILGCAMEIIAARRQTFKSTCSRGTAARRVFCMFVHREPERHMVEVAYRALSHVSTEDQS